MIAVFSALNEEIAEFRKKMESVKTSELEGHRLYEGKIGGKDIQLLLTGMGKEKARRAADLLANKAGITAFVSTGFGGALNSKTRVGDMVICSKLICGEESSGNPGSNQLLASTPGLVVTSMKVLEESRSAFRIGSGITIPSVCSTPADKQTLGAKSGADLVEMESYWISKAAAERKIPFIEVRPVFDTMEDDLSWLSRVSSNGKVKPGAVITYSIRHPEIFKTMSYFAGNSKKAGKNLAEFLAKFIITLKKQGF